MAFFLPVYLRDHADRETQRSFIMPKTTSLNSRRKFLKGAGVAGLAGAMLPGSAGAAAKLKKHNAKNMIFLVVDGMCNGTLGLAHHWSIRNTSGHLNWMQLLKRPDIRRCVQDTASNSSPVTDSAAAASAWGSGQRVNNGALNTDPAGKALTPIYTRAKQAGKRTGLVSTCRISHATPAGFAANVPSRDQENVIISQYLSRQVDILLGGGAKHFVGKNKEAGGNLDYFKQFEASGYRVARDLESLNQLPANGKPILGIFSDSHIPYAIDRKNDKTLAGVPALTEMFSTALKHLDGSEEGFLLQVEAGRVDHAGHANDPAAILHELLEFDACIPIALDYVEKNPDTLLVVTTDHGTGGCQLDGLGSRYVKSGPALDHMNQFKYSFDWLEKRFRASKQFSAETFELATGITPTEAQAAAMQAALTDSNISYLTSKMARVFADELTATTAVGWTSNNHTSECVDLLALGPGAEKVHGFINNNELFGIMTDALRI